MFDFMAICEVFLVLCVVVVAQRHAQYLNTNKGDWSSSTICKVIHEGVHYFGASCVFNCCIISRSSIGMIKTQLNLVMGERKSCDGLLLCDRVGDESKVKLVCGSFSRCTR